MFGQSITVTFDGISGTVNVFEAVSSLVTDLMFKIVNDDDFTGIRICTLDSNQVCVIYADFEATVDNLDIGSSVQVCVPAKLLVSVLKCIKEQNILVFEYPHTDATQQLIIHQYEQENSSITQKFIIDAIDAPMQDELDTEFDYPCCMTISLSEIREFIVNSGTFGADTLTIGVHRSTKDEYNVANKVILSTDGSIKCEKIYYTEHSTEEQANDFTIDNTLAMKDQPVGHEFNNMLRNTFGVKYIKDFLRPLQAIDIRLSMANEMPIRLDYPISEKSFITLFITPRNLD
ncbi:hypothetical protein EXVG_00032 [Emiliania huxleyi virus 202]|nr:hypothetical protein EXVG_00032 [Emiliania huxleyi virus 202]AHA54521.1 putative proliferating cell nuclear antigen [Emiliania huxleyi virus 18]AHA55560.1 putative proliferating cell nuclear antigen [Emiliania huxleyi virus 156]